MVKKIFHLFLLSMFLVPVGVFAKSVKVVDVVDGDTMLLDNGEYVRLIGVDAPDNGACFAEKSTRKLQKLVKGKKVRVRFDQEKTDTFGRKLGYVYVGKKFVNKAMLTSGLAVVDIVVPNKQKEDVLTRGQQTAVEKNRGIWQSCQSTPSEQSQSLPVSIAYANATLDRGDKTILKAHTDAEATCKVILSYPVSSIDYAAPSAQQTDANGDVVFEWRVDPTTPPGEWPITVECSKGDRDGSTVSNYNIFIPH